MSRPAFPAVLLLTLLAGGGSALAAAIQNPDMVVLPDPDPSKAARFPARAATQGEARIGPALDRVDIGLRGCSPLNPCALAEPDHAAMMAPPAQRIGERRRSRRPG